MIKTIKHRFYPTKDQEILLRRTLGCVRFIYNKSLDLKSSTFTQTGKSLSSFDLMKELTKWKRQPEYSWLNEVSNVCLQQSIKNLGAAFDNFFAKRAKYPKFKKKSSGSSARFTTSGFRIKNNQVYIAKSKQPLKLSKDNWRFKSTDKLISLTIRLTPSQEWYFSITVDSNEDCKLPVSNKSVGLDLGLHNLITTSNAEVFKNPDTKEDFNKLRRLQRKASCKKLGSKNRTKANVKVAKCYQTISNKRIDTLHKITTKLIRENQTIVMEDLAVKNMLKNHKLAHAISNSSWSMLRNMLEYKCKWYGRELKIIDRFFPSSKTCNHCGYIKQNLKLSERSWTCPICGSVLNRDINAAKNILAAGQVVFVCGGGVRLKDAKASNAVADETENLNREVRRTQLL